MRSKIGMMTWERRLVVADGMINGLGYEDIRAKLAETGLTAEELPSDDSMRTYRDSREMRAMMLDRIQAQKEHQQAARAADRVESLIDLATVRALEGLYEDLAWEGTTMMERIKAIRVLTVYRRQLFLERQAGDVKPNQARHRVLESDLENPDHILFEPGSDAVWGEPAAAGSVATGKLNTENTEGTEWEGGFNTESTEGTEGDPASLKRCGAEESGDKSGYVAMNGDKLGCMAVGGGEATARMKEWTTEYTEHTEEGGREVGVGAAIAGAMGVVTAMAGDPESLKRCGTEDSGDESGYVAMNGDKSGYVAMGGGEATARMKEWTTEHTEHTEEGGREVGVGAATAGAMGVATAMEGDPESLKRCETEESGDKSGYVAMNGDVLGSAARESGMANTYNGGYRTMPRRGDQAEVLHDGPEDEDEDEAETELISMDEVRSMTDAELGYLAKSPEFASLLPGLRDMAPEEQARWVQERFPDELQVGMRLLWVRILHYVRRHAGAA